MAPISIPLASGISASARAFSSSLSPRALTTTPTVVSRAVKAADSALSSVAGLTRALAHRKRQSGGIIAIPTTYSGLNAGPAPGTVAGIVLGSVFGVILILYLIYTVTSHSGGRTNIVDEEVIRRRSVSRSPSRRRRSRSHSEVVEVRERPRTRERIVVEERRTSTAAPVDPDDDIVEVIEEHSPPRRHRSKRDSGFRTVDPAEFGGGGRPMRKVRR